jgi:hypothetical protein
MEIVVLFAVTAQPVYCTETGDMTGLLAVLYFVFWEVQSLSL